MALDKLDAALAADLIALEQDGRAKAPERVIVSYRPPEGSRGPRYRLRGSDRDYVRMNSNSYLSLSHHPKVLEAADAASHAFGAGPGAVRFIDGTFAPHVELETPHRAVRRAARPRAPSTPPTPRCWEWRSRCQAPIPTGLATRSITTASSGRCASPTCPRPSAPSSATTTSRISTITCRSVPAGTGRVLVIFDGIFSMRGDHAPLPEIAAVVARHEAPLPRRHRHDHGRLARHRRLRRDRPRHRGALRHQGRHLHRHVRQGVRRERRVRGGERDAGRSGPPEGGHLHLHQPARRRGLRRSDRRGGHRGQRRRTRAAGAPQGAHRSVPGRAGRSGLRVDRRAAPGGAADGAGHGSHTTDGPRPLRARHPRRRPGVPGRAARATTRSASRSTPPTPAADIDEVLGVLADLR